MSLFGALVRTAVNVVTLPVAIVQDVVLVGGDLADNAIGRRTKEKLIQIKAEAEP